MFILAGFAQDQPHPELAQVMLGLRDLVRGEVGDAPCSGGIPSPQPRSWGWSQQPTLLPPRRSGSSEHLCGLAESYRTNPRWPSRSVAEQLM